MTPLTEAIWAASVVLISVAGAAFLLAAADHIFTMAVECGSC